MNTIKKLMAQYESEREHSLFVDNTETCEKKLQRIEEREKGLRTFQQHRNFFARQGEKLLAFLP